MLGGRSDGGRPQRPRASPSGLRGSDAPVKDEVIVGALSTEMICEHPTSTGLQRTHDPHPMPARLEAVVPVLRGVGLHQQRLGRRLPEPERRGTRRFVHDTGRRDGGGRVLPGVQAGGPATARGSAAGRRHPSFRRSEPASRRDGSPVPGESVWVGRRPGPYSAGWPGSKREPDAAVVEEDARSRRQPGGHRSPGRWTG